MTKRDVLGNEIKPGARVLWSGGTAAGNTFHHGVLEVHSLTEKMVRVNGPFGTRLLVPTSLVVVDAILDERDRQTCMCGSTMDNHDLFSGHAPVSVYDYEHGHEQHAR